MRNFKENDLSVVNGINSSQSQKSQNHLANIQECQQKVLTTTITCNTLTRTTKIHHQNGLSEEKMQADESDIFAGFNESDLNGTVLTDLNCSYTSLGMVSDLFYSNILTHELCLKKQFFDFRLIN